MKSKVLVTVLIMAVLITMFAGCKSTIEYQNVPFFAISESFDKDGWKPYVSIQGIDKRIGYVVFDAINIDASTSIIEAKKSGVSDKYKLDASLSDQLKLCAQALIVSQDPSSFVFDQNGVTTQIKGVTAPVKVYFDLAKQAIVNKTNVRSSFTNDNICLLYTSPSPRDRRKDRRASPHPSGRPPGIRGPATSPAQSRGRRVARQSGCRDG